MKVKNYSDSSLVKKMKKELYQYKYTRLIYKLLIETYKYGVKNTKNKILDKIEQDRNRKREEKNFYLEKKKKIRNEQLMISIILVNNVDLKLQLEYIYCQRYNNFEVIIVCPSLDYDTSALLQEYKKKYCAIIKIINTSPNKTYSYYISLGIKSAIGDLCWIVEKNSFVDKNFIKHMIEFFIEDSITLVYTKLKLKTKWWRVNQVLSKLVGKNYRFSVYNIVRKKLCIKNTIAISTSCIFKRANVLQILDSKEFLELDSYTMWYLYLQTMLGGKAIYSTKINTFFYNNNFNIAEEDFQEKRKIDSLLEKYYSSCLSKKVEYQHMYDKKVKEKRNKKYISILISIYGFSLGGGEIFPIRLANELKYKGYPVTLHCFTCSQRDERVVELLDSSIPIIYASTKKEMIKLLQGFNFDVINTHHQSNQHLISEIVKDNSDILKNSKHIATMHGMYEALPVEYLVNYLETINKSVYHWTYVAKKNLIPFKDLNLFDPNRFTLIPNGINIPKKFIVTREILNISKEAFVLCLASRAIPEKGWLEAIQIIEKARALCNREIHLLLLGVGPIYEQLQKSNLPAYIHLMGYVNDSCQYYHISDMGILPSYFPGESMPLTIIESFCSGKPVITSVIGETPWLLRDEETGELAGDLFILEDGKVPIDNVAKQVVEFILNKEKYQNAVEISKKKSSIFNIQNISESYLKIYTK